MNSFLSLNLGYYGENWSVLETEWNCEYAEEKQNTIENLKPIMWNYELAPNLESNMTTKVSKHCIISAHQVSELSSYYSKDYYYHFNQLNNYQTF